MQHGVHSQKSFTSIRIHRPVDPTPGGSRLPLGAFHTNHGCNFTPTMAVTAHCVEAAEKRMTSRRALKAAQAIREVVGMAILTDLRDPRIQNVTVTRVEVSGDMQNAKVYVSVMGDEATQNLAVHGLQNSAGYLQQKVSNRVELRYTPRLKFELDLGIKNSIAIEQILQQVLPPKPATENDADAHDADTQDAGTHDADADDATAAESALDSTETADPAATAGEPPPSPGEPASQTLQPGDTKPNGLDSP